MIVSVSCGNYNNDWCQVRFPRFCATPTGDKVWPQADLLLYCIGTFMICREWIITYNILTQDKRDLEKWCLSFQFGFQISYERPNPVTLWPIYKLVWISINHVGESDLRSYGPLEYFGDWKLQVIKQNTNHSLISITLFIEVDTLGLDPI